MRPMMSVAITPPAMPTVTGKTIDEQMYCIERIPRVAKVDGKERMARTTYSSSKSHAV